MVTCNQLINKKRKKWVRKNKVAVLLGRPQKLVKCLSSVELMAPKKPNSAKRKTVRVGWYQSTSFFETRKVVKVKVFVTGEVPHVDFEPRKNGDLLIRGGSVPDLPGVKFKIVRGHKKSAKALLTRIRSRSKYGAKKWISKDPTKYEKIIKFRQFAYF